MKCSAKPPATQQPLASASFPPLAAPATPYVAATNGAMAPAPTIVAATAFMKAAVSFVRSL